MSFWEYLREDVTKCHAEEGVVKGECHQMFNGVGCSNIGLKMCYVVFEGPFNTINPAALMRRGKMYHN